MTLLSEFVPAAEPAVPRIKGLRRLDGTIARLGGNGDNWHMTWAADDRVLTAFGDGDAQPWPKVPHRLFNSRMVAIRGVPPQLEFEDLPGYPELLFGPGVRNAGRYYGFGLLALDGSIYQFLSTLDRPYGNNATPNPFVGAKLIYSADNGATWRNQDGSTPVQWEVWEDRSRKNMAFFREPGNAFSLLSVLQMGKNYEQNNDGYVYVYAPNGSADGTMNQLVMFRVSKDRILDRAAYEYFVRRQPDGTAQWSSDINQRGVVHEFPRGWVNQLLSPYAWHPSVVYVKPLGVYLMVSWGMGSAADGTWFGKPSYLGFWSASRPWGPWTQVHEEGEWTPGGDRQACAYQPQIAPKWIAADGKSFWLVWTDFQTIDGKRPYYSFNAQQVEVLTQ